MRMSRRMLLREVARKPARKAFRLAEALEANIKAVHRPQAEPDRRGRTFRMPYEL